ncbi:MAG: 50S ribosomal protein L6 [Candidatus Marinimicrobia bacterium]|nr:50S ribosomal protein L6 [Candidatus Neomarinimicrobiota bacterium]|tara:strand:+ start:774 stop:1322 length:549 start_codon:yes stop_codon:yes gene_type:complete
MSNIGKQPIIVPDGTEISINNNSIIVKGKLGELSLDFKSKIQVNYDNNIITVLRKNDLKDSKELHGLYRALIQNMVDGVTSGFSKELELNGVGYTAEKKGDFLLVNAGYSHPVYLYIPDGINIEVPSATSIVVKGISKQNVGDIASKIRSIRKPEPYKGKGIKYIDEVIRRKAGKKVGSGAA